MLACLHPPMVVGWPGSEAADRASGPPHAFEARANRTLPHRCNLLLAYHCLLACFACLLLLDGSGDANGGGSSDGASGSGTRQGSSSSVTQRPPHEEATLGEVIPSMPGGPALASQAKSRSQKQVKNSTKMVYETAKFSFLRGAALAVPSAVPSRGCPHSASPQQMPSCCPRDALTAPSQHKARLCSLVRAVYVALRASRPNPFHAMFCTRC